MRKILVGVLALGWAASLGAAVPEGRGSLGLGLGIGFGQTLEQLGTITYKSGTALQGLLEGDFPLWSGLSVGLRASGANAPYTLDLGTGTVDENVATYALNIELNAYPAAFAGKPFHPGDNANPDGWLLWPSLSLQYSTTKNGDYNGFPAAFNTVHSVAVYSDYQDFGYQLTLPLTTWLTVNGGYRRNSQYDFNYSDYGGHNSVAMFGGIYEDEWATVVGYINLVPGAGADTQRAFVPHLGRLGQLRASFTWTRGIMALLGPVSGTQTYSLDLGAPLGTNLGLGLSVAQVESDARLGGLWSYVFSSPSESRNAWQYGLTLTWAFGDPAKRTD